MKRIGIMAVMICLVFSVSGYATDVEKVDEMVKDGANPIEAAMAVDAVDANVKDFLLMQKSGE